MFTSPHEMDAFDDILRELIKEQQVKLSLSDEAVGKIAFGFMGGSRTKIQAIFVGQGADQYRKKQKLRLTDVMNLCEALGLNFSDVVRKAQRNMK